MSPQSTSVCRYVAVGLKGPDKNLIKVYDTRTLNLRVRLESADMSSSPYKSLCFSPDSTRLMSVVGSPDFVLTVWDWEKERVLQSEMLGVKVASKYFQCSFCSYDPTLVCVSGYKFLRFLKIQTNNKFQP